VAHIIDGKILAQQVLAKLKVSIKTSAFKRPPGLATVLVGDDPASHIYVANKRKKAESIGMLSFHHGLPAHTQELALCSLIDELNHDPAVDGILVQLPLPKSIRESVILETVDAKKDVDGFHPLNLGYLLRGEPTIVACTPLGIMHLLKSIGYDLQGKLAVVVGRSTIVGKPMAHLLLQQDATVIICHAFTKDLASITKQADVVVCAVGKPKLLNRTHIKQGAVVIDVGINRDQDGRLCGDVDFDDVFDVASYITPTPGGVGPMTIAMLLQNTMDNFFRTQQ
jgi:methylenetetrahydrofolate dehydrogenase (NADP+) / methenyltetrahydrofolate cyclohydrolase